MQNLSLLISFGLIEYYFILFEIQIIMAKLFLAEGSIETLWSFLATTRIHILFTHHPSLMLFVRYLIFHKRKTMIFGFGVKRIRSHFLPRDNQLKFLLLIEPFLDLYFICVVAIVSQYLSIDGLYRYLGDTTTISSLIDLY